MKYTFFFENRDVREIIIRNITEPETKSKNNIASYGCCMHTGKLRQNTNIQSEPQSDVRNRDITYLVAITSC
jgi:hypothetical protein